MDYSPKRLMKVLEENGWELDRIKSSHHIFKHSETGRTVPIPVHGNRDLGKGLFYKILKQTGINREDL
ncbi:type II toxin-antitoxin system HicA family toxin [Spirosoma montaniterrae]|uniref:Toxin HicA n=1 Tax=Spirosoma montaniterrae TaxID=1178516 RepID=A0A1P9WU06_9BACT|nr:type II toxin-antitoxin system HicA family toxin [Spirosoma montaniterrae]AQG78813.1 hypothetical protein AWR27_05435 [Spirosoma montaniterrae]